MPEIRFIAKKKLNGDELNTHGYIKTINQDCVKIIYRPIATKSEIPGLIEHFVQYLREYFEKIQGIKLRTLSKGHDTQKTKEKK